VAFGALLLSTVDNALIVAQVPPDYNNIIVGAILIGAVAIDHLRRKRLYRRG
jgi:ribose transport system permease protein